MEYLKLIALSFLEGVYDSIKNIGIIYYLDKESKSQSSSRSSKTDRTPQSQSISGDNSKKLNKEKQKEKQKPKVRTRVFQCGLLNGGIFLLSILLFDYALLPALEFGIRYLMAGQSPVWSLIQTTLSIIFGSIWVIPLFFLSKVINTFWFQDIADAAYKYRKGQPATFSSLSKLLADVVFSLIVQSLFLFQSMSMSYIPYVGKILCFLHICLLYSLYSFEYKWFNQGFELHKRLMFIESNWPYYIGFGFVLAVLTQICDSFIINGCLFSIFFPLFIISGNESSPQQRIQFPIGFFSLVVTISNSLVSHKLKPPTPASKSVKR